VNAARRAATRAARNTVVRAVADLTGKLASLALFVVLAREEGPAAVGTFVFGLAWSEIAFAPVNLGFDRYLLRQVAGDHAELDRHFFNVLTLKLRRAALVLAASSALILVVGEDSTTRITVLVLSGAFLLDGLSLTVQATFNALERAELIAVALITQRLVSAGLGVVLLLSGLGVVAAAVAYAVGSTLGLMVAIALLARRIGMPARILPQGPRRELVRASIPFAAQDVMWAGVARVDAVILGALATQAIVGYYGAAYRLLEATLFLSVALQGAFAAMYTYLSDRTEPTINAVVQRSLKFSLALLTPCAVVLGVLAEPILELIFGARFDAAVTPLRLLALTVVPLGITMLMWVLITARREPRVLVIYSAVTLAVNVALNLALIPPLDADGAALAMFLTYAIAAPMMLRLAIQSVGRIPVGRTVGAPLAGGAAMAVAALALEPWLIAALPAAAAVYAAVFGAVERKLAPADFDFLRSLLARRFRRPRAASLPEAQPRDRV
jgi:O-antigen/teichoic acid export membrane protein